jgi:conjugal transfer ATP-binding protein TraC
MNIQTSMYEKANKGRRKFLGMDEAWDLLSGGGNSAQFFEKGVRRVRKYGGSLFTITQSVDDYLVKMGATGLALLQNSDFKFLLRQLPESIERMRETGAIKLSDFEYTLLSTVNRGRGYSEIFSITPFGRGIMRLTVPRRMQLMYTTDPNELAALDRLRGAGASQKTYQEAIDLLLEMEVVHQGA